MEDYHYSKLLKAHKIYREKEGRWRFYDAYMESRDLTGLMQSGDMPLKEGLLLFGFIQSWDPNFKGELYKFLKIYSEIFPILKQFEFKKIEVVNLDEELKNSIVKIFNSIAKCARENRFESTDTSKILHVLFPEFFIMWDNKIREAILGNDKRDGEAYANEFLPKMQEEIKAYLKSYIKEKGVDYSVASQEISKMADNYSLPKLIDEKNFIIYTKGIKL